MTDAQPAPAKRAHQKAAVAIERFALGAHQADAASRRIGEQAFEAGRKSVCRAIASKSAMPSR